MDIFSEPFSFRFGKKDEKKSTSVGMLSTILVIGASLAYLVYLLIQYATNSFAPTIISEQQTVDEIKQTLDYSPIMFKFNLPPVITTSEQSKYFRYYAQMAQGFTDGSNITIVSCSTIAKNSAYSQYYCLKTDEIDEMYIDSSGGYNQIYVRVWMCTGMGECKTNVQIKSQMEMRRFSIEVLIAYWEFDPDTELSVLKYRKRNIPGDSDIVAWQIIELKQTQILIDKGFLFESWTEHDVISDFSSDVIPLMQSFMQTKYSLNAPVFMQFEIRMELASQVITVQYIKLSAILAMFSAIFGVLLNIGILARLASKSVIYQEMLDNYIKEYYKESAFQIIKKRHEPKGGSSKGTSQEMDILDKNQIEKIKNKMLKENLLNANGELQSIFTYLDSKKTVSTSKVGDKNNTDDYILHDVDQKHLYAMANQRLPDLMNAKLLYNEVYTLKTAVQMLFSPEQYATLMDVGRRLIRNEFFDDLDKEKLNHLEQLNLLDENPEVREKLAHKYLTDLSSSKGQANEIDKRIFNSLLSHVRDQLPDNPNLAKKSTSSTNQTKLQADNIFAKDGILAEEIK